MKESQSESGATSATSANAATASRQKRDDLIFRAYASILVFQSFRDLSTPKILWKITTIYMELFLVFIDSLMWIGTIFFADSFLFANYFTSCIVSTTSLLPSVENLFMTPQIVGILALCLCVTIFAAESMGTNSQFDSFLNSSIYLRALFRGQGSHISHVYWCSVSLYAAFHLFVKFQGKDWRDVSYDIDDEYFLQSTGTLTLVYFVYLVFWQSDHLAVGNFAQQIAIATSRTKSLSRSHRNRRKRRVRPGKKSVGTSPIESPNEVVHFSEAEASGKDSHEQPMTAANREESEASIQCSVEVVEIVDNDKPTEIYPVEGEGEDEVSYLGDITPLGKALSVGGEHLGSNMAYSILDIASSTLDSFSESSSSFSNTASFCTLASLNSIHTPSPRKLFPCRSEDTQLLSDASDSIEETNFLLAANTTSSSHRPPQSPRSPSRSFHFSTIPFCETSDSSLRMGDLYGSSRSIGGGYSFGSMRSKMEVVELALSSDSESQCTGRCSSEHSECHKYFVTAEEHSSVQTEVNPFEQLQDLLSDENGTSFYTRNHVAFVLEQLCEEVCCRVGGEFHYLPTTPIYIESNGVRVNVNESAASKSQRSTDSPPSSLACEEASDLSSIMTRATSSTDALQQLYPSRSVHLLYDNTPNGMSDSSDRFNYDGLCAWESPSYELLEIIVCTSTQENDEEIFACRRMEGLEEMEKSDLVELVELPQCVEDTSQCGGYRSPSAHFEIALGEHEDQSTGDELEQMIGVKLFQENEVDDEGESHDLHDTERSYLSEEDVGCNFTPRGGGGYLRYSLTFDSSVLSDTSILAAAVDEGELFAAITEQLPRIIKKECQSPASSVSADTLAGHTSISVYFDFFDDEDEDRFERGPEHVRDEDSNGAEGSCRSSVSSEDKMDCEFTPRGNQVLRLKDFDSFGILHEDPFIGAVDVEFLKSVSEEIASVLTESDAKSCGSSDRDSSEGVRRTSVSMYFDIDVAEHDADDGHLHHMSSTSIPRGSHASSVSSSREGSNEVEMDCELTPRGVRYLRYSIELEQRDSAVEFSPLKDGEDGEVEDDDEDSVSTLSGFTPSPSDKSRHHSSSRTPPVEGDVVIAIPRTSSTLRQLMGLPLSLSEEFKEEGDDGCIDENISVASSITYSVSKALGQVVVKKESSPKLSMYGVARSYLSTGSHMLKQSKDLLIQTIARKKKKKRRSLADDLTVVMPIGERRRLKILDSISSMANLLRSIRDEKR